MGVRTSTSTTERGTRPRPLRRQILDRVTPARLDDYDCLRFPSVPPPQGRGTEKKESEDRPRNRACRPSGKPFLITSCALHQENAHTVPSTSTRQPSPICQSSASVVSHKYLYIIEERTHDSPVAGSGSWRELVDLRKESWCLRLANVMNWSGFRAHARRLTVWFGARKLFWRPPAAKRTCRSPAVWV